GALCAQLGRVPGLVQPAHPGRPDGLPEVAVQSPVAHSARTVMAPRCLLGVLLCLLAGTTSAADRAGNYAIWGAGGRSCHQLESAGGDATRLAPFRDYLMGYLTAVNSLAGDTYDAVGGQSLETAMQWIGEYCAQHHMDSFERAIAQVLSAR